MGVKGVNMSLEKTLKKVIEEWYKEQISCLDKEKGKESKSILLQRIMSELKGELI